MSELPPDVAVDRRRPPRYESKKTARKAVRETTVNAVVTGLLAAVAALTAPEAVGTLVEALSTIVGEPWNVIVVLGLPPLLAFVSRAAGDWGSRVALPEVRRRIGRDAFEDARERHRPVP